MKNNIFNNFLTGLNSYSTTYALEKKISTDFPYSLLFCCKNERVCFDIINTNINKSRVAKNKAGLPQHSSLFYKNQSYNQQIKHRFLVSA